MIRATRCPLTDPFCGAYSRPNQERPEGSRYPITPQIGALHPTDFTIRRTGVELATRVSEVAIKRQSHSDEEGHTPPERNRSLL